jgi:peptidoglycan hydrolase-like protein with peptidoglycan-binding domain
MNNDDVKKFINISNLYTEVLDVNQKKQEKVDENWFTDTIKSLFGGTEDETEKATQEIIKAAPEEVTQEFSDLITEPKAKPQANTDASIKKAQDQETPNLSPGPQANTTAEPVVTTADQANSIFQDPNATAAQRKAAQDFYNANKDDQARQAKNAADDDTVMSQPVVTPGTQANTDASIKKAQDQETPNLSPGPQANTDASIKKAQDQETPNLSPGPQDELDATDTAQTGTDAPGPQGELDATDTAQTGTDAPDTAQPNATAMAAGQAGAASTTAPSNGSLLGRKLDTTTANLMKAYNDGGKKSMPSIKNMQTALSRLGFDPNGLDGKYGNGTFKAVQDFQKANGLSVDGQAGPSTMAAIKKALDDNFEKNKVTPADQDQSPQDDAEPEQKSAAQKAADEFAGGDVKGGEFAGMGNTTDDAMDPKNQQKDIDTAQPNADLGRYVELLNKLEGGQVNASYDFRDLIALVESKLLNEKLTPAEMEELKALHNKVQGHVGIDAELDTKITAALNRYLKLVKEPADKADAQNKASDAQLIAKGQAAKADAQNKASDAQLIAKGQAAKADAQNKASDAQLIAKAPKVSAERFIQKGGSTTDFNVSKMKAKYPKPYVDIPQKDGTVIRGYGAPADLELYIKADGKRFGAKIIGKAAPSANLALNMTGPKPTTQTASKDNNMKKAIEEASMNISINGDSAAEVAELAGILKNAGMHDAKPVSDIMPHAHDGHDDMVSTMRLMDQPAPDDSPCGMGEEGVEEEWDNSPDESYADTQTMTKDLSGGLNREKKSYKATQDGDNPMAVETSIKEQLWAALNEKMTAEGRGRGKKMKLKASRGNEDIKTTEGSRGKKSRGKKSRG